MTKKTKKRTGAPAEAATEAVRAARKAARRAAKAAAPAPAPEALQVENPEAPSFDPFVFPTEQRVMLERLSANLARASLTAQGVFAEMALRQADQPAALNPDPMHVGPALNEVFGRLAAQPDRLMRAQADLLSGYLDLWRSATERLTTGEARTVVAPPRGDRRFSDPDWEQNPVFDMMKQSYLLTANWMNGLISGVDGVEPETKRRAEFFVKMLTDAFSPSNFLASNPAALREAAATGGESLVKGMKNFAADVDRGGGALSIAQTDYEMFKVGENVGTAPGQVVFRNEIIELIQYAPATETVHQIPLLIFPPWINKFYILDLRPENSMIRWLTSQGFTVFVVSWVNPGPELADKTLEDYMRQGVFASLDAVRAQCRVEQVNTVGYCIGGTLLGSTLAYMAKTGDERIASATFFAAQQDFSEAGDLTLFANEEWVADMEARMDAGGGVLSGKAMADTFNSLRANDLIWSFFVNNYLMGKDPKPFDLLFWNSDQTRMPKTLHLSYLRKFYGQNALAKGELELGGELLDLRQVKTPIYVQSAKEDHIAPARSVYRGARLFGGPVTFIMSGSGHIAGVINPPAASKYQFWSASGLSETLEAWQTRAVETPGSWWPHWAQWLADRSGPLVAARDPSGGPLEPITAAPGTYVLVKS